MRHDQGSLVLVGVGGESGFRIDAQKYTSGDESRPIWLRLKT
jgi:hypothetical protein